MRSGWRRCHRPGRRSPFSGSVCQEVRRDDDRRSAGPAPARRASPGRDRWRARGAGDKGRGWRDRWYIHRDSPAAPGTVESKFAAFAEVKAAGLHGFLGGQESYSRHWLAPVSKTVASASGFAFAAQPVIRTTAGRFFRDSTARYRCRNRWRRVCCHYHPSAVIPRAGNEIVLVPVIVAFEQFVNLLGAVKSSWSHHPAVWTIGILTAFRYGAKAWRCQKES